MPPRLATGYPPEAQPPRRVILAALPLALTLAIAGSAAAASPDSSRSRVVAHPFVGAWGASTPACANHDDFYVNTLIGRTRFLQYELECTITRAIRSGSTWTLVLACQREGDDLNMHVRLNSDGDDRLTIVMPNGPPQHLRRCTAPMPAEYRSTLDD